MNQILHAQLTPITLIDGYFGQQGSEQSKLHSTSTKCRKCSRNRGVFLSHQGWQKLVQAGALYNKFGERYTHEQLSERSQLDERTISRLLSCEIKVDKNTLRAFFRVFNIPLEVDDYTASTSDQTGRIAANLSTHTTLSIQKVEFEQIVAELAQLKQRLREYDRLFQRLGLNEDHINQQVGA